MNAIVQRDQVREAVVRALQLDPERDLDAAIAAAAAALCLPPETVSGALEASGDEALS